jgi:YVTN family beta-propeller protein
MAEDERIDIDNNKPIYTGERSSIQDNAANLNVKGLTGKTKLYFLYPDGTNLYIQRIFYGKDNNDGNVKISYSGYFSDYLKYWPIAKKMIESITLDDEIKQIESHGISVGESPSGILYDENDDIIFVVNQKSKSVSVINATNFQVIKLGKRQDINIENVTSEPFDLAYNSKNGSLYVVHNKVTSGIKSNCTSGAITKMQFNKPNGQILFNDIKHDTLINEKKGFCPVDIVINKDNTIFAADPILNELLIIHQEGENTKQSLGSTFGGAAIGLALDEDTNKLYIANPNFKGVQIFDTEKNKIEEPGIKLDLMKCPVDIIMDQELDRLYVVGTTAFSNCDSPDVNGIAAVIDSQTGEVIKDNITIGQSPNNVIINHETHKIHVTNTLSDSITVIDPLTFKPNTVNVGINPFGVTTNSKKGLIYTTSQGSNSVSMINEKTNKINHLITFKIEPSGSGIIKCENSSFIKVNKLEFVSDNTKCAAEPTKLSSFVFQSWSSDTAKDLRNEDNHANNPLFEFFGLGGTNSELPIKTSGTYTANFVQSQSLLTPEQLTGLYTLAVGIFSTWLIPSLTRWIYSGRKSRIQNNTFSSYLKEIQNLDKGVIQKKREEIIESLSKGKLSESQYHTLDEKLSKL